MEVTARVAVEADVPALVPLVAEGIAAVEGERGAELWLLEHAPRAPLDAALHDLRSNPATEVIAGCVDGVPVGVLVIERRDLVDGRSIARITLVFVHPRAREIGVGEALIGAASGWAEAAGCIGIDGLALPGDRRTKNLYERSGMTAREITVHRELRS
jgi:GNAT superfamily N-acetyltransferase